VLLENKRTAFFPGLQEKLDPFFHDAKHHLHR
jgi:hypothetical protein